MFNTDNTPVWCRLIVTAAAFLALAAGSTTPTYSKGAVDEITEIRKSPNDVREYRSVVLPNGLQVVVIHDADAEKAAASLDVAIGSGSDPSERQGLAHFLEHMLFLGTEKYPDASEYSGYIRDHGGFNNAFTSFTDTNYYFDIEADYLEEALDRFAQFFIAPLFTEDLVLREKNAVHSEYSGRRREDGRRVWDAKRKAYNPDHPITQFSTGSLETLADRDGSSIRDELIDFYEQHYSANIMTLAVLGTESLDELEQLVREKFSAIKNRDSRMQIFRQPLYVAEDLPQRLDVRSLKDQRYLSMEFEVANSPAFRDTKPSQFIGHLLGHEGEGSLLSALKKRGFAESLSAGGDMSERSNATFGINIGLTPAGYENIDEIVEIVFGAIERIKTKGVQRWHFEEQKKLSEINFRFQEKSEPAALVRSIAIRLQEWPAHDVLVGPFEVRKFDPAHVHSLLSQLRPDRLMLTVVAPESDTDSLTRFFEAPYQLRKIEPDVTDRWAEASPLDEIRLPQLNPFVPENLELVDAADVEQPGRVEAIDGFELWHQTDTSFGVPRANFYVSVRSELANASAKNAVLMDLFVRMVNERLNEFAYPAALAGLGYELYRHVRGFTCRISGYSDGQEQILSRIFEAIRDPNFDEEEFLRIRDDYVREISNFSKQPPYEQTIAEIRQLIRDPYWSDDEQIEAAKAIDLEELSQFVEHVTTDVAPVAVSHGNVSQEDSVARAQLVREHLSGEIGPRDIAKPKVVKLKPADAVGRDLAIEHDDSAVTVYVQADDDAIETRANMAILTQALSQPFYDEIRTRQQVGYFVFASSLYVMDMPGLMFSVQSPSAAPETIVARIDRFIADYFATVQNMSDEEFERYREAVLSQVEEPDKQLSERTGRYWREIDREEYDFDSRERFIQALRAATRDGLVEFYERLLIDPTRGRAITWSRGKAAEPAAAGDATQLPVVVEDIATFKSDRERFVTRSDAS